MADGTTVEEILEELHSKGGSGDLLDDWRKAEEKELKDGKGGETIPPKSRALALHIMGDLVAIQGLDFHVLCEVVLVSPLPLNLKRRLTQDHFDHTRKEGAP